jgi:hypothetical protein
VPEPGKLIALQAIARCRQQELPRGKGVVSSHGLSPE